MADVAKVTVYVTDMSYLERHVSGATQVLPETAASASSKCRLALPDVKVEIEAIATVD
jgi:enamine deaminase RidA (YjgF/YER057c/UK114 family)